MIKQAAVLLTNNGNSYLVCGKDVEEDPEVQGYHRGVAESVRAY